MKVLFFSVGRISLLSTQSQTPSVQYNSPWRGYIWVSRGYHVIQTMCEFGFRTTDIKEAMLWRAHSILKNTPEYYVVIPWLRQCASLASRQRMRKELCCGKNIQYWTFPVVFHVSISQSLALVLIYKYLYVFVKELSDVFYNLQRCVRVILSFAELKWLNVLQRNSFPSVQW